MLLLFCWERSQCTLSQRRNVWKGMKKSSAILEKFEEHQAALRENLKNMTK